MLLRCHKCDVEVCSEKCSQDDVHSEYECGILKERKGKVSAALLLRSLLCLRFVFHLKYSQLQNKKIYKVSTFMSPIFHLPAKTSGRRNM